jgi:putative ABC transport system permease protein
MYKNYLKTGFRYLLRNFSFTVINVLGLTAGISAFLLISLFIQHQLSFDRSSPNSERLFRLVGIQEPSGLDAQYVAITSAVWVPYLLENAPQVDDAFRVMYPRTGIVEVGDQNFREQYMFFSERNVVQNMGYSYISAGDPEKALNEPNKAVLSISAAERFFGHPDVVGKTIKVGENTFMISGVFDNKDVRTHLKANVFLSFTTIENSTPYLMEPGNNTLATYMLLKESVNPEVVAEIINNWQKDYIEEHAINNPMKNTFYLQSYEDIFLRSKHIKFQMVTHSGDVNYIYVLGIVAVLVLIIACINFINLSTANSSKRAREVGLRKVLGASRDKLAIQFIGESMIVAFFSGIVSLVVVELLLPSYNAVLGTNLRIDFSDNWLFSVGFLVILFLVGIVSGFYPAIYLSRYEAGSVLGADRQTGKPHSAILRKILVVFQFAISTAMIFATITVMHQVNLMKNKDLGYNSQHVISIFNRQLEGYDQLKVFKDHLLTLPGVVSAGISSGYNGVAPRQSTINTADSLPQQLMVRFGYVDADFFPSMEMKIDEGRNFDASFSTDPYQTIIINRAAQKALGWENPLGKRILNTDQEEYEYYKVIGVVEDYHYYSLHNPIEPAVYIWAPEEMNVINVRYSAENHSDIMSRIQHDYESFFPGKYFDADYLSSLLERNYESEQNIMKIFLWFAVLCILISSLGLLGLTSFMVNQRRKEIGIRKVLGGSIYQINLLLLLTFFKWVVIASFLAIPFTWYILNEWLFGFAYHIQIGIWQVGFTLLIIVLIASATILSISTKAASQNPVLSLKYE